MINILNSMRKIAENFKQALKSELAPSRSVNKRSIFALLFLIYIYARVYNFQIRSNTRWTKASSTTTFTCVRSQPTTRLPGTSTRQAKLNSHRLPVSARTLHDLAVEICHFLRYIYIKWRKLLNFCQIWGDFCAFSCWFSAKFLSRICLGFYLFSNAEMRENLGNDVLVNLSAVDFG